MTIDSVTPVIENMRIVKRPEELACIRAAVNNAQAGIEAMMASVHPGMHEYELQAVCGNVLAERGEMLARPMVATAGNAVILHYPEARAVIGDDDLVLIDFCPRSNYYASDVSRAFPASGRFTPRQRELYSIGLDANKRMIEWMRVGTTFREMNQQARGYLAEGMRTAGLIDSADEVEKYYYHNVSHYIGLGIHDVGDTELPIPANSVMSIDTGVYVAEEGIGLRVEDTVLVTESGCESLSSRIIKEIDEIEEFMAARRRS
jgi:Xaa-Pro aminopeptidase